MLAPRVATLFSSDLVARATAALYIQIVSVAYAGQGLNLVVSAGLNLLERPFHATGLSIPELFGIAILLAFLGSRLFGLVGISGGTDAGHLVTGAVSWLISQWMLLRSEQITPNSCLVSR